MGTTACQKGKSGPLTENSAEGRHLISGRKRVSWKQIIKSRWRTGLLFMVNLHTHTHTNFLMSILWRYRSAALEALIETDFLLWLGTSDFGNFAISFCPYHDNTGPPLFWLRTESLQFSHCIFSLVDWKGSEGLDPRKSTPSPQLHKTYSAYYNS